MPIVMVHMKKTEDIEVKKALAKEITDILEKNLKVPRNGVGILFKEDLPENVAMGGVLMVDKPIPPLIMVRILKTTDIELKNTLINDISTSAGVVLKAPVVMVVLEEDLPENIGGNFRRMQAKNS